MKGITPNPEIAINLAKASISTLAKTIANLSNIKYEIKRNFSDKEIIDKVLSLDLIE